VTNDLYRRVTEHKEKLLPGFTSKYNINRLVYYEEIQNAISAIEREKQIKGWLRVKNNRVDQRNQPELGRSFS